MLLPNIVSQIEKPCNTITLSLSTSRKSSESVVFHRSSRRRGAFLSKRGVGGCSQKGAAAPGRAPLRTLAEGDLNAD